MAHPVIHFELGAPDGADLALFYEKLFGWEVTPSGPEYWLLVPGGGGIGGGVMQTSGGMPPYLTIYIAVDDLEQALRDAQALGASSAVPPMEVPGVGRFALVNDPAGHLIGLMEQVAEPPEQVAAPSGQVATAPE
jgi:predicted enzyme related to lactoylglutathione lyase